MTPISIVLGTALLAALTVAPSVAMADANCQAGDASEISVARRVGPEEISAAKTMNIVEINPCELSDVLAALSTKGSSMVRRSIAANPALEGDLQSQGFTAGDILGAVRNGTALMVYVKGKDTGAGVTTLLNGQTD